jgi:hypothetical protein
MARITQHIADDDDDEEGKKKDLYTSFLRSFGFVETIHDSVEIAVTSSDSITTTARWKERMLADMGDGDNNNRGKRSIINEDDIDCEGYNDYGGDHDYGLGEELTQQYHEYCLANKDSYYSNDYRHAAYYYYYYHPHVVCDFDLEFHGTAGICEHPGTFKGLISFHILILIFSNGVGIAGLITFYFDYRSGVLFL